MNMMKKTPSGFLYLITTVALILVAIITTAIINISRNRQEAPADIRARAGVTNTLKLTGIVSQINDTEGILMVDNVQFDEESRSGPPQNLGTWSVTPPPGFALTSVVPGDQLIFTVEAKSFNISSRSVTAIQLVVSR